MGFRLGLHQITVNDLSPVGLVETAHATGCEEVVVFTHIPRAALPGDEQPTLFPVVDRALVPDMLSIMSETGVTVGSTEFFPVTEDVPVEDYREGFAVAAAIGARRAVTHIHDPVDARAVDTLGRLCDLAAEYDLRLGLEFMGLSPACATLDRALWFAAQAGRANMGVGIDALHLMRSGGSPADLLAVDPRAMTYAQICDADGLEVHGDYLHEALERQLPGDGVFPLGAFVGALPRGIAIDVEVPSARRISAGLPALDHAREAVARSRSLLERLGADRRGDVTKAG